MYSLDISGLEEIQEYLDKLEKLYNHPKMKQAMLDASIELLGDKSKGGILQELQKMVYNRKESPYYQRTTKLMQSTQPSFEVESMRESLTTSIISNS